MVERKQNKESEQDKLRLAYSEFRQLALRFGTESAEGGKTFVKYIPKPDNGLDVVTGRYFGDTARDLDIFFRKGKEAVQLTLTKNELGNVTVAKATFLTQQQGKDNLPVLIQTVDENKKVDIDILNQLLFEANKTYLSELRTKSKKTKTVREMVDVYKAKVMWEKNNSKKRKA